MDQVSEPGDGAPARGRAHCEVQPQRFVDFPNHHRSDEVISSVEIEVAMRAHFTTTNRHCPYFREGCRNLRASFFVGSLIAWPHDCFAPLKGRCFYLQNLDCCLVEEWRTGDPLSAYRCELLN
jgi:hypothetical protein